ncbi:MAG: hypothetical protein AB9M53_03655 [Leptothrix sp. (in: b-proteobacteria)]
MAIACGEPATAAEVDDLLRALRLWVLDGARSPLERWAGLPTTPGGVRRAARNAYLMRAASMFHGTDWERAHQLHKALTTFRQRRWEAWHAMDAPPTHADALDALLWHALRAGAGAAPGTAQGLLRVLERSRPNS